VDLLNRVFSTHLIDFLLRATKQERNSALTIDVLCLSWRPTQGSVFCTCTKILCSRWRRSSTLGWYSRSTEVGTKELIHGLAKLTQFCAGADPANKFRGRFQYYVAFKPHYTFTTLREMKYTSQNCCDKTMDDTMGLYRECCFPNCKKLWWIKILSKVFGDGDCPNNTPHPPLIRPWFCASFIAPWWRNGCFQRAQTFQLLNRSLFRTSPVVMNLRWRLKEYWQKNRGQRWDVCEESTVWHFVTRSTGLKSVKPGMSNHLSESRDPTYVSSAMYIQNVPEKNCELSPSGYSLYTHWKAAQVAWPYLQPCLVPSWCGNSRTIWNCCWPWGISGPSRSVAPRLSPKEKWTPKWVNEWICTSTLNLSIYEIVFSLFDKNKCRIQISISGRKLVFLWKSVKSIRHTVEGKMVLTP